MSGDLLALVMIVKDEAASIVATIESCKPHVDRVVILDTGSTDGTQDLIRQACDGVPLQLYEEPFVDFGTTRNRALELAGERTVFTLMLSGDETLVDGAELRTFCEQHRADSEGAYLVGVDFGPRCFYPSPRLARASACWRHMGRVHEVLVSPHGSSASVEVAGCNIRHDKRDAPEHSTARWEESLALMLEEHAANPANTRTVFYIAQNLHCLKRYDEAAEWYEKRFKMGGWPEEVFFSLYRRAECMGALGNVDLAVKLHMASHSVAPDRAEPLYRIAEHYRARNDHALTYLFASRAAALPMPGGLRLFVDPPIYQHLAHELVGISAYYIGEDAAGRRSASRALLHHPDRPHLAKNLGFYFDNAEGVVTAGSHAVIVLGTGRSGTSAVAGMLEAYGIPMGDDLLEADTTNPHGFYEDAPFVALNEALLAGSGQAAASMQKYLLYRAAPASVWGIKDPRLCDSWPQIKDLLPCSYTVVHVTRPLDAVVESCVRAYGERPGPTGWREIMERRAERAAQIASETNAVEVPFEKLLDEPEDWLIRILSYIPRSIITTRQSRSEQAALTIRRR